MDVRQILAMNVVRLRRAKELSQEALAWEAGVSRRYMARIEGGQASIGILVVEKLAAALGCEPYELLLPPPKRGRR